MNVYAKELSHKVPGSVGKVSCWQIFEEGRRVLSLSISTAISARFRISTVSKMVNKMSRKEGEKTGILFEA